MSKNIKMKKIAVVSPRVVTDLEKSREALLPVAPVTPARSRQTRAEEKSRDVFTIILQFPAMDPEVIELALHFVHISLKKDEIDHEFVYNQLERLKDFEPDPGLAEVFKRFLPRLRITLLVKTFTFGVIDISDDVETVFKNLDPLYPNLQFT